MTNEVNDFLMVTDDDYCQFVHGEDPDRAVVSHYDEMNAMCAIQDPDFRSEFSVTLYEIGASPQGVYDALLEKLDESEYTECDRLHAQLQPDRREHNVVVLMTADDLKASLAA